MEMIADDKIIQELSIEEMEGIEGGWWQVAFLAAAVAFYVYSGMSDQQKSDFWNNVNSGMASYASGPMMS